MAVAVNQHLTEKKPLSRGRVPIFFSSSLPPLDEDSFEPLRAYQLLTCLRGFSLGQDMVITAHSANPRLAGAATRSGMLGQG